MLNFISDQKKVELHAHLHGCIPLATLYQLIEKSQNLDKNEVYKLKSKLNEVEKSLNESKLEECFEIFPLIQKIIQTKEQLKECVLAVLKMFEKDNLKYLELRTTPRETKDLSKLQYVQIVVKTIEEFNKTSSMKTKLLLSIDRSKPIQHCKSTILLLSSVNSSTIVGVDFSGNPKLGNFENFKPFLKQVKQNGYKLSIHCAELKNFTECIEILDLKPERLGHCLHLPEMLLLSEINDYFPVIEVCPTSNCRTLGLKSFKEHPHLKLWIKLWREKKLNLVVCTDDTTLFNTNLSNEILIFSQAAKLTKFEIRRLIKNAESHRF